MATVPVVRGRQQENAPLNTPFQTASGATPETFGGGQQGLQQAGADLGRVGGALAEARLRIQERNNAVARAEDFGAYKNAVSEQFRVMQQTDDLSNPETVRKFHEYVGAERQKLLSSHAGGEDSAAQLDAQLASFGLEMTNHAATIGVEVGQKKVMNAIGEEINTIAAEVGDAPETLLDGYARLEQRLSNYTSALPQEQIEQMRRSGVEAFVGRVTDNLIAQPGGVKEIRKVLATPEFRRLMSPQAYRSVAQTVARAEAEDAKARKSVMTGAYAPGTHVLVDGKPVYKVPFAPRERAPTKGEQAVEALGLYKELTGRDPSEAHVTHILGLSAGGTGTSAVQKLAEANQYMQTTFGRQFNQAETLDFFGVNTERGAGPAEKIKELQAFRAATGQPELTQDQLDTLQGLRADTALSLADKIEQVKTVLGRDLTEAEVSKIGGFFIAQEKAPSLTGGVGNMQAITWAADTSADVVNGRASDQAKQRLMAWAEAYIQPTETQDEMGRTVTRAGRNLPKAVVAAIEHMGMEVPKAEPLRPEQSPKLPELPDTSGRPRTATIFEQSDLITGPVARAATGIGSTPGIGGGFPEQTKAQEGAALAQRNLVRILQNNPKYAEGERQAIEKEVDLAGKVMDDPGAYRQRLTALDDFLEERYFNAIKTAGAAVGRDERIQAMNVANGIAQFRERLMPPRPRSQGEYDALEPGVVYLSPSGEIRRKKAAAAAAEGDGGAK